MYRTVNRYSSVNSLVFDPSDGINNNFISDAHPGETTAYYHRADNEAQGVFHPAVTVFGRSRSHATLRDNAMYKTVDVSARGFRTVEMEADFYRAVEMDADMFGAAEMDNETINSYRAQLDFRYDAVTSPFDMCRHADDMAIVQCQRERNINSKRSATAPNSPGPYRKKHGGNNPWTTRSAAPTRKNSIHFETLETLSMSELYKHINAARDSRLVNAEPTESFSSRAGSLDNLDDCTSDSTVVSCAREDHVPNPYGPLDNDHRAAAGGGTLGADSPEGAFNFVKLFHRCRLERDASFEAQVEEEDDDDVPDTGADEFLCAERVSQMTKTYNDIEAVTRLLEEKERDLELAARIGQTLLSKNNELTTRSEILEEQLTLANDRVNQLRHDLSMKDELLRFYNEDLELQHGADVTPNEKPASGGINVDFLEKKVKTLEDENLNLRLETAQMKSTTDSFEEKEKRLVEDCIQQLGEVNQQVEALAEELHQKCEESAHQKEEITCFLAQIADLQKKIRKLTLDNMDLHEKLTASTESQRRLTKELGSMQDKYDELLEMLEEAQDELRVMRSKHKVRANGQHHHSAFAIPNDSLASELETSLQQELSQSNRRAQSWKVFETARAAKRAAAKAAEREALSSTRMSVLSVPTLESDSTSQGQSTYPSDVESFASDGYNADMDSLYGSNTELGRPGIPGSNDLESALKRLAMRKANELNERDFHEEEERRKHKEQESTISGSTSPFSTNSTKSPGLDYARSPSSLSSTWSIMPSSNHSFKISDKLQIVKPMEGSMTLRHWQHLATPTMGGIFEERDGVQIRGEKKLDLVEEMYSLSDFEEDDDPRDVHTRKEQDSSMIYTFTDSTVRNPGPYRGLGTLHNLNVSSSSSLVAEDLPLHTSSPKPDAHLQQPSHLKSSVTDNTQSTYSMSLGLAALLQGRENTSTDRTLSRVSATKINSNPPTATKSSSSSVSANPSSDFNQRVLSSRSLGSLAPSSSLSTTLSKNLPGSRSLDPVLHDDPSRHLFVDPDKKPELFKPGMTGQGFLQQLKNKGYSLYGLWGGKGKEDSSDAPTESSADGAVASASGDGSGAKATAESVFSNGAGVGVLGALTNFRRSGIL
ncbi:unnamed protein product [Lymnaea stagnalis]|uniref:Trafficking kinesin-binding protein 1 n=1 Tax=Lymnaea stagnalis TaxID=6523 RepID=A0AAV2ILT8_LYMST